MNTALTRVNRLQKGRLVTQALQGNVNLGADQARDEYTRLSLPTAKKTATALDQAFRDVSAFPTGV
jgi:hypothetical protein